MIMEWSKNMDISLYKDIDTQNNEHMDIDF